MPKSAPDFLNYSYSDIRNAIGADGTSSDDLKAFNSLPGADPTNGGTFFVASAEAAALGLQNAPTTVDGYIGFSNAVQFDYNAADGVSPGAYDFFAAVAHEVSEVMGRELGAGYQGIYTPLDLFDLGPTGFAFNDHQVGAFSLGNIRMPFNTQPFGDSGDWDSIVGNDAFDAFGKAGAVFPVSPSDFVVMDALGWDQRVAPDSTLLLLLSASPSDDAFQVPVAADITLMFNRTVEAGSGDIVIHNAFDGTVVETIPVTDTARVSFSGSVVTINPSANLPQRSGYYVTIASGAITDLDGSAYSGISSVTALNFTTGDAVPNVAPPEITVLVGFGLGQEITNGDTTISTNDGTDFGSFPQGNQSGFHIFTVRNDGGSTLTLGPVNLPAGFLLLDPLVSSLGPGGTDAFWVQLDTTTPGIKGGQVSFTTNDSSENPFTFAITGTVTIPTISIGNASVTEGGILSFAVTLNRATSQDITLNYNTSDGTATVADNDYLGGPGTLVIHAGQSSGTITIQTVQDSKGEPDQTMSVQLLSASYGSVGQATGTGTILNDDPRLNGFFSGDGRSEILCQNDDGRVAVWLVDQTLQASKPVVAINPGTTWHVKGAGDFNSDGKADILWQSDSGQAAIWLMDGAAQLGGGLAGANPGPTWHVKGAGDFNGDGKSDILWQNDNGSAGIWLMDGTTLLTGTVVSSNPGTSWHVKGTGDFNGDGNADILWQNDNGQAAIWLIDGTTQTAGAVVGANPGSSWHIKGTGDFDRDGKSDILWQNDNGQAAIWLMNGTTQISGALVASNPGASWHVKGAEDLNGDGNADILWQNDDGSTGAWLMNGTNVISVASMSNPGTAWHMNNAFDDSAPDQTGSSSAAKTAGDFNGDGMSDFLWQNDDGRAAVWLMNGLNPIGSAVIGSNPGPAWHVIGAGDFNGDQKSDILWQNDDGRAQVWLVDGTTQIGGAVVGANPGPSWHVKGAGDFNGDGKSDILWQNDDGRAGVWLIDGTTQTTGAVVGSDPGPTWHVKGAGDFNGDGKADILWQNDDGSAGLWLMDGTTMLTGSVVGTNPGASWHVKGAGDFNGDGKADILWQNDDGSAGVWLMDGTTQTAGAAVGANPGTSWHIKGAGDFNGDGKADILWQNDSGQAAVWLMDGLTLLTGAEVGNNPGPAWHLDWA